MRTCMMTCFLIAVLMPASRPAGAADDACGQTCCDRCGCRATCLLKTCPVCEVKKETRTCWCIESKDICPLLPGLPHCGKECPPPHCGNPKCVKRLVKKEYQVEVPVYKCVVQRLCCQCAGGSPVSTLPCAAPNPPAPPASPPPPLPPGPVGVLR